MSIAQDLAITAGWCDSCMGRVTIDMLPYDVLLIIFAFYVCDTRLKTRNGWPTLAHVCRKWRDTVFGSPHHLNLQLVHTEKTLVRETLDIWPPFLPIAIETLFEGSSCLGLGENKDNLMATLKHNDRICKIKLNYLPSHHFAAMQVPFPTLADLNLGSTVFGSVIPDSFLGGSAPRLQRLALYNALYLGLPKLLSSASDLVQLTLWEIVISPEAIVTSLSMMARLKKLVLRFKNPQFRADQEIRRPPPPTLTLLPSLTYFLFDGISEYMRDFVALIDTPLLNRLDLSFFKQDIFDTPQFAQFISRSPQLRTLDKARIFLEEDSACIVILGTRDYSSVYLQIDCGRLNLQLESLTKICSSCFPQALINIAKCPCTKCESPDDIYFSKWLKLFRPFLAVKNLYLSQKVVRSFAAILQYLVGERVTQVFPALQQLFVEWLHPSGSDQKVFEQFITARRQLSSYTIASSHWDGKTYT
jgi:hypothetical protein